MERSATINMEIDGKLKCTTYEGTEGHICLTMEEEGNDIQVILTMEEGYELLKELSSTLTLMEETDG